MVDQAVVDFLHTETGKQVGLGKTPLPIAEMVTPWAVVYPLPVSPGAGSMASPEDERDFLYQVSSAGVSRKETAWMSQAVFAAFCQTRQTKIVPEEEYRLLRSQGAIVPSGEDLYLSQDTYLIRIGE